MYRLNLVIILFVTQSCLYAQNAKNIFASFYKTAAFSGLQIYTESLGKEPILSTVLTSDNFNQLLSPQGFQIEKSTSNRGWFDGTWYLSESDGDLSVITISFHPGKSRTQLLSSDLAVQGQYLDFLKNIKSIYKDATTVFATHNEAHVLQEMSSSTGLTTMTTTTYSSDTFVDQGQTYFRIVADIIINYAYK